MKKYQEEKNSIVIKNHLESLTELIQKIKNYNASLESITSENMFDLYELKMTIKENMKGLDIQITEEDPGEAEFVKNVRKIHANLV